MTRTATTPARPRTRNDRYVSSSYAAKQAADIVRCAQDANDTLIVVDAVNNDAAWFGIDQAVSDFLQRNWSKCTADISCY